MKNELNEWNCHLNEWKSSSYALPPNCTKCGAIPTYEFIQELRSLSIFNNPNKYYDLRDIKDNPCNQ